MGRAGRTERAALTHAHYRVRNSAHAGSPGSLAECSAMTSGWQGGGIHICIADSLLLYSRN